MITSLLRPRWLIALAIAGFVGGAIALYAASLGINPQQLFVIAPTALFVGVFCTILAAIMITTPEDQVSANLQAISEAGQESTVHVEAEDAASASMPPPHQDEPNRSDGL